jgi:hypothetical protein
MVVVNFIGHTNYMKKLKGARVYVLSQAMNAQCCGKVLTEGTMLSWPPSRVSPHIACYTCFKDKSIPKKKNYGKRTSVPEGYYEEVSQ